MTSLIRPGFDVIGDTPNAARDFFLVSTSAMDTERKATDLRREYVLGWALVLGAFFIYLGLFAIGEGVSPTFADNFLVALYLWPLYLLGCFVFQKLALRWNGSEAVERPLPLFSRARWLSVLACTLIGAVFVELAYGFCQVAISISSHRNTLTLTDDIYWGVLNFGIVLLFYLFTCAPALFGSAPPAAL